MTLASAWVGFALLAAAGDPGARLLEVARQALANGDQARATRAARGLASLGDAPVPQDLAALGVGATPTFRLYGSRLADRVRVGLEDPAGLVGRLDVLVEVGGQTRALSPLEDHAAGRLEFGSRRPIPPDATIILRAWMTEFGTPMVLREVTSTLVAPPTAPPKIEGATDTDASAEAEVSPWQWWWIGAGVLAAALTGAAVWQETR